MTVRRGIPLGDMGGLPLVDQLKALLLNGMFRPFSGNRSEADGLLLAHVASFTAMTKLLPAGHDEDDIVAKLPEVAVLVNGAWVLRRYATIPI